MTAAILIVPVLCQTHLGPNQEECRRWPTRSDANSVVVFIDNQIAFTRAYIGIMPHRNSELLQRIDRLELIRAQWNAIDNVAEAVAEDLDDEACADRLATLREMLGEDAYYARRPPPILP